MKQTILLHNPSAGEEDHFKSDLVESIGKHEFNCVYFAIKKGNHWIEQLDQSDFAVVAGGDGTIRAVVKELTKRTVLDKKVPLAILPMGTANNLSKSLGIDAQADREVHIKNWKKEHRTRFDLGVVKHINGTDFFLESAGYGIFPHLMQKMEAVDKTRIKNKTDELKLALTVLRDIVLSATQEDYRIEADNRIYEGKSLLLEVMNIRSIGPNLTLAPDAETDDGVFDIVLIEEEQREKFAQYLQLLIEGEKATFSYKTFRTNRLSISCTSRHMHIDDELILPIKHPVVMEVRTNVLEFLT